MVTDGTLEIKERTLSALFVLLRAGLWNKDVDDLSLFPLADDEWQKVYRLACAQTIVGIVYEGMCKLSEELLPPDTLLMPWVAHVEAIEQRNRRMNQAVAELYSLFAKAEISPVLLKGQGVALLYSTPSLRECGDIDFYFLTIAEFQQALNAVKEQGISVCMESDGSACYQWNNITVEHHLRLVDISNPFKQKFLKEVELRNGFEVSFLSDGTKINIPSPLLNLLLLNTHILKHALGWGVGIRQLCDMALACHDFTEKINQDEFEEISISLGIRKWNKLLHSFLLVYLGLPAASLPYHEKFISPVPLLNLVMKGGNFGQNRSVRIRTYSYAKMRKLVTLTSFLSNIHFSLCYAAKEYCWLILYLLKGRFK